MNTPPSPSSPQQPDSQPQSQLQLQPGYLPQAPIPPPAKKPWYLRWWSITIGVVLFLSCLSGIIGDRDDESDSDAEASETSSTADVRDAAEAEEADDDTDAADDAEEPEEEEEPDYFASQFPVFEAVTESGSGDSVIDVPAAQGIITASYSGSSNFILTGLDEHNEMSELPVNTIGSYEGTTVYGLTGFSSDTTSLEVTAAGSWEITIAPIADAPELGDPEESQGDGVYRYTGGATTWELTHDGDRNFIVTYVSDSGFGWDLVVNEIGSYDGTSAITSGPAVVTINADGAWSIASS